MKEYKKTTKEDIDFPRYCHFFIKEILESLEENDVNCKGDELELILETPNHPYCYDAFELVVRTLGRKGFESKIPTFHLKTENGEKVYVYKWVITKM